MMPPRRPWETRKRWWKPQYRHGPYTQVNPASKKIRPQQAHQRTKYNQLHGIAEEGLRIINSELDTMAWARNQQIWLRLDQRRSTRARCKIVHNHGEALLMNNQELYSMMVEVNWTLKTRP